MEANVNAAGRRKFSPELKLQIIKQAKAADNSVSVVARKYDINANQVFRWMREMEKGHARWVQVVNDQLPAPKEQVASTFLPVAAVAPPEPVKSAMPSITLELASGHRVTIENADASILQILLTTLA